METGFEKISDIELCREWHTIMSMSTLDGIKESIRFLRICQELDERKLDAYRLGSILASTNNEKMPTQDS